MSVQAQREEEEVYLQLFATSTLEAVGGQHHAQAALPQERLGTHWTLGGLQERTGPTLKILPPTGIRSQDHALQS